jgi:UDP-glucose 4-epimerase|tara:strand:+ start:203 stop:1108 length:906 start_codon:yes stop_codon:yes gene_type:complete
MSKALVTGGAGFIGSNLVDRLIDLYDEIVVIDNLSSETNEKFYFAKHTHIKYYELDICDYENTRRLYNDVDVVFHLAAESRIQPTLNNPILAANTNTVGTCTVLQCSKEAGVKRVIYSSTSSGYGLKNTIPLDESMTDDCLNPYSVTKVAGEKLCKMYYDLYGLETVVFRYFNVYGERHPIKGQYAPVIGIFIRQKNDGEKLTIVGNGEKTRDFTHVYDIVEGNILASNLENKKPVGQLINLGTGKNYSILDVAKLVGGEYTFIKDRLGEAQDTKANNSKAKDLLGWRPKIKLEDWIKDNN